MRTKLTDLIEMELIESTITQNRVPLKCRFDPEHR